ncbi:hypothetical protein CRYUN_Cryun34aG0019500 [Craigia yunnanensis]
MPQRHSKNNNDLAFFTYAEKRKLGKLAVHTAQQIQENEEEEERDKNEFQGANSVKVTSYEEEALRRMKAFWLPSATPEAPVKVDAPSTSTNCPEGKEKLKLKSLFSIYFTEDDSEQKKSNSLDKTYICPSCKVTLTNTLSLIALSSCGHVFCKKCADRFMAVDEVCLVCDKACKERNLVPLEKGGTGFTGHGDHLEASDFKHLGSGSGLGLVRPTAKT